MDAVARKLLEERFGISGADRPDVELSVAGQDLLDAERIKELLVRYTPMVKGQCLTVGEIYMANWFRWPMLGLLYSISVHRKAPNLALSNMEAQVYPENAYYANRFKLADDSLMPGPAEEADFAEWASKRLADYFEATVRPVFEAIARAGELHISMLWGQLSTMLDYGYRAMAGEAKDEAAKCRIELIFGLVKMLEPWRFGRNKNPFAVQNIWTESLEDPDKQVPLKHSCCLYYKVEGGSCCFTCPRLKEDERQKRRDARRASLPV